MRVLPYMREVQRTTVLLIDALTFVLAFVLLFLLVPSEVHGNGFGAGGPLLAGVRVLLAHHVLRPLSGGQVLSQTAYQALMLALPVLAFLRYGANPRVAGALVAGWGAGAFLGSLVAFRAVQVVSSLVLLRRAWLVQSLVLWFLIVNVPSGIAVAVVFVSGIANGLRVPPMTALWARCTSVELRPQAFAVVSTVATAGTVIALVVGGPAIETFGVTPVFAAIATISTASAWLASIAAGRQEGREASSRNGADREAVA